MLRRSISSFGNLAVALLLVLVVSQGALARPTVGVVLGGGAARGLSHIGLLKAFDEEGIPVDLLVGASMGSIVAGLYAAGMTPEQLEWMVQEVELSELFAPRLPLKAGVFDTGPFERFLHELTGALTMEELSIPFYSVITHIVTGETIPLGHGPLSRAIIASMSIPGMFPPVEIDGGMYVDGGIMEPVPAATARRLGADVVIAVDVRRELEEIDHDSILTNLQLTLYFVLDHNTEVQLEHADIVIAPGVETASYMEYGRAAEFIAEGYAAAKAAIPEIKALLREKDPAIEFVPRNGSGTVDEAFRARFERALAAAEKGRQGSPLSVASALTFEAGKRPLLDLEVDLGLAGSADRRVVASYEVSRRLARERESAHQLGLGLKAEGFVGEVFWRKEPGDLSFVPGAGIELRWGEESGGRLLLGGEWRALDPQPAFEIDLDWEWSFPLKQRGVWELAVLEPAPYVGAGVRKNLSDAASPYQWRVEAGLDFGVRLFGIYPLRSRLALTYRGGDSPWALAIVLGEAR